MTLQLRPQVLVMGNLKFGLGMQLLKLIGSVWRFITWR